MHCDWHLIRACGMQELSCPQFSTQNKYCAFLPHRIFCIACSMHAMHKMGWTAYMFYMPGCTCGPAWCMVACHSAAGTSH